MRHYEFKFGISIHYTTKIGLGFYIGHFGGIIINSMAVIGNNVNISQGVTIGNTRKGVPIIGDNTYLGAGAKVIGSVTVGNNVAIGANCVVTKDIPDDAIVIGNPCEIVSYKGNKRSLD